MYLTIEAVKSNPLFRQVDASGLDLKTVAKAISMTQSAASKKIRVDRFALTFYTLNHAYSEILNRRLAKEPLSKLEAKICTKYEDTIEIQARFLFAYLTLACVREARHADDSGVDPEAPQDVRNFFESIIELPANEVVDRFIYRDINCTAGEFYTALSEQFEQNNYPNSFGGKPWADIANCCLNFVKGTLTAEVFVDLGYHLEHNNGSVFNKDFIFSSEKPDLQKILDCQASGQAPNLICNPTDGSQQFILDSAIDASVRSLVAGRYNPVDWSKVFRKGNPDNGTYTGFITTHVKPSKDAKAVPTENLTTIGEHSKHKKTGEVTPFAGHGLISYQQVR